MLFSLFQNRLVSSFLFYTTLCVTMLLCLFLILGIYAGDVLNILAYLSFICTITFWPKNPNHPPHIKKVRNFFLKLFQWIFQNPGKISILTFLNLFLCRGLHLIPYMVTYDTGIFLQSLSNPFWRGVFQYQTLDPLNHSFLGIHFEPYLFLLSPIRYLPFPNVFLYAIVSLSLSLTLYFGVITINELFSSNPHEREDSFLSSLQVKTCVLLYGMSLPFWRGLIQFEFHELALIPLFHLLLFRACLKKSYTLLLFSLIGCLMIKETVCVSFLFIGFVTLLFSFRNKSSDVYAYLNRRFLKHAGFLFLSLGLICYVIYFKMIMVNLHKSSTSTYIFYFDHLGKTNLDVLLSPILNTKAFLHAIFAMKNLGYFFELLYPIIPFFLFSSIKKSGWLLLALPTFAIHTLSQNPNHVNSAYQYGGEIMIPLCLMILFATKEIWEKKTLNTNKQILFVAYGVFLFLFHWNSNPIRTLKDQMEKIHQIPFAWNLSLIPKDTKIYTNDSSFLPFVSTRPYLIWKQNAANDNCPKSKIDDDVQAHPDHLFLLTGNLSCLIHNDDLRKKMMRLRQIDNYGEYQLKP
jgi:uncharacterized membrane protein